MIPIFIGYDPKEPIVFHVCANSIIRQSTRPVSIIPLALNLINSYKEVHNDGSNNFIYSRFLVPHLMNYTGQAIYIDGDMVIKEDINQLWQLRDHTKSVQVVKHNYKTRQTIKYLSQKNENYPRKNWSSMILWNCSSDDNKVLTPEYIMNSTGSHLHRFQWINDDYIGELPIEWNWLPDELGPNYSAKLLHYTLGAPCFKEFVNTEMADDWHKEHALTLYCEQKDQG